MKKIIKTFTITYTKTPQPGTKDIPGNIFGKRGKLHESMKNTVTVSLVNYSEDFVNLEWGG